MKQIQMADTRLTESEIEAAVAVMRSGALRQGKECAAFEKEFSAKVGAKHSITCANGSAALHLAYMAFLQPGDEVLVPAFTFIATASMVSMAGGKPIFCDVDRKTWLIDLENAARKLTPKTKAISPVHLFGNACEVEAIRRFADTHGLKIVWDAAQSHGALYKGKDIGSFGDFVCYSFYPTKNMFVGEGGMICTDNADYAHRLNFLRAHGQTGKYYHTMLGLNYRMTDVEGAIGRKQLLRLDEMLAVRRRNAALYNEAFASMQGIHPQVLTPSTTHAWHQYCVVIEPENFGCDRDSLEKELAERGVVTGVHYPRGLHQQPVYEEICGKSVLSNTEYLSERILALPVHHGLTEDDVRYVIESIRGIQSAPAGQARACCGGH